jgi:hypothetical protein
MQKGERELPVHVKHSNSTSVLGSRSGSAPSFSALHFTPEVEIEQKADPWLIPYYAHCVDSVTLAFLQGGRHAYYHDELM